VEVEVADGAVVSVTRRFLDPKIPGDSRIIEDFESTRRRDEIPDGQTYQPLIRILMVLWRDQEKLDPDSDDIWTPSEAFDELHTFVQGVTGKIPIGETTVVGLFQPHRQRFGDVWLRNKITEIRARLARDPNLWIPPDPPVEEDSELAISSSVAATTALSSQGYVFGEEPSDRGGAQDRERLEERVGPLEGQAVTFGVSRAAIREEPQKIVVEDPPNSRVEEDFLLEEEQPKKKRRRRHHEPEASEDSE
jgi:hypothetical protein